MRQVDRGVGSSVGAWGDRSKPSWRRTGVLVALVLGVVAWVGLAASASGEEHLDAVVALDPDGDDPDAISFAQRCEDVKDGIVGFLGHSAGTPIPFTIPHLELGPAQIGTAEDQARITINCGGGSSYQVTVNGPFVLAHLTVDLDLTLTWADDSDVMPDVVLDIDLSGDDDTILAVSDVVGLVTDLFPALAVDAPDLGDFALRNVVVHFASTDGGNLAFDLSAASQLVPAPPQQPDDPASDTVDVGYLLSVTKPAGDDAVLLNAISFSNADQTEKRFNLAGVLRGPVGRLAGQLDLPNMWMAMVQPAGAELAVADLRPVPKAFFPTDLEELPTEFRFDGKLTIGADLNLDALGDGLQSVFGWSDGAVASAVGKLGFDFGTVTDDDPDPIDLTSVDIDITLPALAPGPDSPLPDWLALESAELHIGWVDDGGANAVELSAKAGVRVTIPDTSQPGGEITLPIDIDATIGSEEMDDGRFVSILFTAAPPESTEVLWPEPFGLSWLDINTVGVELLIQFLEPGDEPPVVDGVLTANFDIGGKTFDLRLHLSAVGDEHLRVHVLLELRDTISLAEVLGLFGDFDLPGEFDLLTIGGDPDHPTEPRAPLRISARLDIFGTLGAGGTSSVSVAVNAPGTIPIAGKPFDLNFLFSIAFPANGDPELTAGARTAAPVTVSELLGGALPANLVDKLEDPDHILSAFNFEFPTIGLVVNSTSIAKQSGALTVEEHEFFRWLFGCGGSPAPQGCLFDVDLPAGIHLLTGVPMPTDAEGKPLAADLLKALWVWDDGGGGGGDAGGDDAGILAAQTSSVPPPPEVQFRVSVAFSDSLSFDGVELALKLPVKPGEDIRPDWFHAADLSVTIGVDTAGSAKLELAGSLGVQLRDETVAVSNAVVNDACERSWLLVTRGDPERLDRACYDVLTFRILAQVSVSSSGASIMIGGDLLTQPGIGWPEPLGIPFLRIDAAKLRLGVTLAPAGPQFEIGLLAAGALFDKDFSGSLQIGLKPLPNPPFVVPTFGGLRVASQAGLEIADIVGLYDFAAGLLDLPDDLVVDLDALPNIAIRNLELMVGLANSPDLCIEQGFRLAGELYLNAEPLTAAPTNQAPDGCNPSDPGVDADGCITDDECFAAVFVSATVPDGLVVNGQMGAFSLGPITWDDAVFDLRFTPTQQRLQVKGGIEIAGLARGSVDLTMAADGVAFLGDVELFPGLTDSSGQPITAFRALIEGELALNLRSFDFSDPANLLDLDLNLHAVLQADFESAVREVLDPIFNRLRANVLVLDAVVNQLLASGDPMQVVLDLPGTLRDLDQTVPLWLDDLIGGIAEAVDLLEEHGLTVPDLDTLLTATIQLPGLQGTFIPAERTCYYTVPELNTLTPVKGTVIGGVCWSDPPDAERWFWYPEGRLGRWVEKTCWAIEGLLEGTVVDGTCYRIAPSSLPSLCDLVVAPLLPPGTTCDFAALRDHVIHPALNGALEAFGFPAGTSLTDALDTLVEVVGGALPPVSLPCVDFRLTTAGPPGEDGISLRIDARLFSFELKLDVGWDFGAPPALEALRLATDIGTQLFSDEPDVSCEPIGTTTVAGGAGGGADAPLLNGFRLDVDPTSIKAGEQVTLSATVDGTIEATTTVDVDWGDGDTAEHTVAELLDGIDHTYLDDHPDTGTPSDHLTITVTILDKSEQIGITVENNPPTNLVVTLPAAVDEGEELTLSGSFKDPDPDSHTLIVDWGDGDEPVEVPLALGARTFEVTHTYLDDNPTRTPFDAKRVRVAVVDDDTGRTAVSRNLTVHNVAPHDVTVTPNLEPGERIEEGDLVQYTVAFEDPGVEDTHLVRIDWGDGGPPTNVPLANGERSVTVDHVYLDDDPTGTPFDDVTVTVTVTDDDSGTATEQVDIVVYNVDPIVTLTLDEPIGDEGDVVEATVSFTDPGVLDTHTITVDWGDPTFDDTVVHVPAGVREITLPQRYGDNGAFAVTATVVDDDTGQDTDERLLVVRNVDPDAAIDQGDPDAEGGYPQEVEGSPVVLADGPDDDGVLDVATVLTRAGLPTWFRATASDPGSDDLTFTWLWDLLGRFGLGSTSTAYLADPEQDPDLLPSPDVAPRVDVEDRQVHTWDQPCLYQVGLEVVDDDLGWTDRWPAWLPALPEELVDLAGATTDDTWVVVTGTDHRVRNAGWWDGQYDLTRNRNRNDLDETTLGCYLDVARHMSRVFDLHRSTETPADARQVLLQASMDADDDKLDRQLLTTWLNLAHGSLGWFDTVATPEGQLPLLDALRRAEEVWIEPDGADGSAARAQRIAWKDALEVVNDGGRKGKP